MSQVREGERWQANPRESPLYQEHPNTHCDEHGVLTCLPFTNTARKRIYTDTEKYCEKCFRLTEHSDNKCVECGEPFVFQAVAGIIR